MAMKTEKIWPQVLAIVIACLSAITVGLLFSWSSPFIVKITNDKKNYHISEAQASYFTIIPPIAMILTCPLFSKLCDLIGRKRTLLLISFPHIFSWTLTIVSKNLYVLYAARFCSGIGDGCLFSSLPMYIGEISIPKVRGAWGNLVNVFVYFGVFLVNVIGSYFSVKETACICIPLPVIYTVLMCFMPESPIYYIKKGRDEDAKKSLRWLRGIENVEEIHANLKSDVERQMSETGTWKDLVMIVSNRKALIAGVFLRVSQLLGGATAFIVYTKFIFVKSGSNLSSEVPTMIYTGLCFCLLFVAGFAVEKIGRKKAYICSLLSCGIILFLEATYLFIDQNVPEADLSSFKWFPIFGMIMYVICSAFGITIIPTLMLGELFSASIKAKGLSILILTFGLMIFVSNYIFSLLNASLGLYGPFLFFACSNLISTFLSILLIPETKGKTLEEIQQKLKKKKNPA